MTTKIIQLVAFGLLCVPVLVHGQTGCMYTIDTAKVLANENLDAFMTYLKGGLANSTRLLLVRFEKNKIVDIWAGLGSSSIQSVTDAVQFVGLHRDKYWGLNTNIIIL